MSRDDFLALHAGLPRQGPGSDASTRTLLHLSGPLPVEPRALDIGCGPGRSSLVLAADTGAQVVAVDTHEPFLEELQAHAGRLGLSDRITTMAASMDALDLPDGSFDVVWSEGAAYLMGFDQALSQWSRLLAPGGAMVVTECEWTTARPSAAVRDFWRTAYPGMRSTSANVEAVVRTGLRLVATYRLPDEDWWNDYYTPLGARLDTGPRQDSDVAAGARAEIELRRAHPRDYGYTGYVMRRD